MSNTVNDLMNLSPNAQEQVRIAFDPRRPFGPSSANGFRDFPQVAELAFSTENQIWREYLSHPRMIVGRKGSGKTSVLQQTQKSNYYKLVHRISTSEMIEKCVDELFTSPTDTRNVSAEIAGKVWTQMINTSLMTELLKKDKKYPFHAIEKYFEVSGLLSDRRGRNLFALMRNIPSGDSSSISATVSLIVSTILHLRGETGLEYENAVVEMDEYLCSRKAKCVVILDSIEEYPLHDHQFSAVLKGLLRCTGAYGSSQRDIRIGIPAELYYDLRSKSSNISKDFEKAIVLHWSPMELLRIIAWRYLVYLSANDRNRLHYFSNADLSDRADVHRILTDIIPVDIMNRSGDREVSVAYILRHTQLLPRQIIKIFNETFSTSRPNAPQTAAAIADRITGAVRMLESQFCEEVCGAYKIKYPFISDLCKNCIPSLPRFFDEKILENIYRRKGKKTMQEFSHIGDVSFSQFKEALFEIGAIGRVRSKTEMYADADFEYAIPGRLYASDSDELCLHPSFSGTYESSTNRRSEFFVYPHLHLYEGALERALRL
ncbi:P-loop ATPase, Sll1717 family [Paracoccus acridae]|uniref:P-loop ATPase, Sll1717 family n=1 Tax=Paracoccus acridae TaxID=1795310 RepID=UPI0016658936|nr:hypothetical protein [Paracoccus acridae]